MNSKAKTISFLALYASFIVAGHVFIDPLPPDSPVRTYVKIPFYLITGVIAIIFFWGDIKEGFGEWRKHPIKSVLFLAGLFVANIIASNLASIPGNLIYGDAETMNDANIQGTMNLVHPALIIIVMGILGPMVEETVFRIIMIRKWSSRIPVALCIIISSVLFMLIHVHSFTAQELIMNLDKLATGILYGITVALTRNVTIPCASHIINNTLGLSLMIIASAVH